MNTDNARHTSTQASSTDAPAHDIGSSIRSTLTQRLGANRVRRYLGSNVSISTNEHGLSISANDPFTLGIIERRLGVDLESALRELDPRDGARIQYQVLESPTSTQESTTSRVREAMARRDEQRSSGDTAPGRGAGSGNAQRRSNPNNTCPTLLSFLVSSSNSLAHASVVDLLGSGRGAPPVFIHGSCGVGKTHLLRGAAQHYRASIPGAKVRYITGEAFTNSFVQAVRTKTVEAFERRFKDLDLLCLDDVHLVAGKEGTQNELLQIFNTLSLSGAKILIASDAHPSEIERFHGSLASRLSAGVVARVEAPDHELGMRLARVFGARHHLAIDEQGYELILGRIGIGDGASVRELEGAFVQIHAMTKLLGGIQAGPIAPAIIERALQARAGRPGSATPSKGPIPVERIVRVVCEDLGVTREELSGRTRHKRVVLARELLVHAARELTTASYPEIARAMGRSNHSTVITAARRIETKIKERAPGIEHGVGVDAMARRLVERVRRAGQ